MAMILAEMGQSPEAFGKYVTNKNRKLRSVFRQHSILNAYICGCYFMNISIYYCCFIVFFRRQSCQKKCVVKKHRWEECLTKSSSNNFFQYILVRALLVYSIFSERIARERNYLTDRHQAHILNRLHSDVTTDNFHKNWHNYLIPLESSRIYLHFGIFNFF